MSAARRLGLALAVLSASAFGVMPVLTEVAYHAGADPFGVLSVRFTLAAAVLAGAARWRGERFARGRTLLGLLLLGGVGYVVESLCYFAALQRISAGLTALLLYAYPALVVVLASVLHRTRPAPVATACVVAASAGTALTIGPVSGGAGTGVLLGLGAAVSYSVYIVVSSSLTQGLQPLSTAAVVMGACGAVYDVLAVGAGARLPGDAGGWAAVVAVSLVGTVIAVSAFFAALALLGPGDTAVVSTVEPVVSVVTAWAVLGETLSGLQVAGGVVVLGAVAVLARTPARAAAAPVVSAPPAAPCPSPAAPPAP